MFGCFKKYDVHLCSSVSGTILNKSKPLVGIKVERELYYIDDKTREDSTITDENGYFTLPAINVRSKSPGSWLCEAKTTQVIGIELNNIYYKLWSTSLNGTEAVSAYDKKLSQLNADISNDLVYFTFENAEIPHVPHSASSICRWESDFEIQHIVED